MDIQGHRGCRGLLPENSLIGFEKAIELGVTTLELDVVISRDRKVVVSHEPYMNPTICLNPYGSNIFEDSKYINLYQIDYDSISQYDCGSMPHPNFHEQVSQPTIKPTLNQVFDLVKSRNSDVSFNIEIKSKPEYYGLYVPFPKDYVGIVTELIANEGFLTRTNLQSFDINILEEIHKQYPDVNISLLVDEDEDIKTKLGSLSFKADIISPYFKLLNQSEVFEYQQKGFKVIPWTVNTTEDMVLVSSWNVDGIITDYPNRLIELIKS